MWLTLIAGRLEFPAGRAEQWLAERVDPSEVLAEPGAQPYASAFWRQTAERMAIDGCAIGDLSPATVPVLLERARRGKAGLVEVRGDVVCVRGEFDDGQDENLGRVVGVLACFARAAAHGAQGALLQFAVQPPHSDDATDLAHWLTGAAMLGARLGGEQAFDLLESARALEPTAFEPEQFRAHPSGDDFEAPDDDGFDDGSDGGFGDGPPD